MITLSGHRFVGASQAGETRDKRPKRVKHAIKQSDRPFAACTAGVQMAYRMRFDGKNLSTGY
jgi:hypothetical protein